VVIVPRSARGDSGDARINLDRGRRRSRNADIPECVSKTLPDLLVIAVDGPGKRPALVTLLQELSEPAYYRGCSYQNYGVCYWARCTFTDVEPSEAGFLNAVRGSCCWCGLRAEKRRLMRF
jgi:hypothetical protein